MNKTNPQKKRKRDLLRYIMGRFPGRTMQRLGAAFAGIWVGSIAVDIIWSEMKINDRLNRSNDVGIENSAFKLNRKVNLLLFFSDRSLTSKSQGYLNQRNRFFENAFLISFPTSGSVNILKIPLKTKIILPGIKNQKSFFEIYEIGKVRLLKDILFDLTGVNIGAIDRYLVITYKQLKTLIAGLGYLDVVVKEPMLLNPNDPKMTRYLPVGTHELQGKQLADYLTQFQYTNDIQKTARMNILSEFVISTIKSKKYSKTFDKLFRHLYNVVDTNLSFSEASSLVSVLFESSYDLQFQTLPGTSELYKMLSDQLE